MPANPPSALRLVQTVLLALGGAAMLWWFFDTPNFHNALQFGLGHVLRSPGGGALAFFGIPAAGLAMLGLAGAVYHRLGGAWLSTLGWLVCGLIVVGLAGAVLLFIALDSFHMH